ncbi:uncharacterized protein LOC113556230 [Rhopalosiphum maidis]|uniref:uncharacterized protein LOC113556230 n=1 Tax=Rhopalosiphum maidis TaxID=43146 RepID=UPI000EFEC6D0|nr:uncharacterized protein LOC113556230 [Rhopalosiphum maidis]
MLIQQNKINSEVKARIQAGRIAVENSDRKGSTRKKTTGTPKIKMRRQSKRRRGKSKARRGLKGIIVRKRKLEANLLDGMVLKAENHEEEVILVLNKVKNKLIEVKSS